MKPKDHLYWWLVAKTMKAVVKEDLFDLEECEHLWDKYDRNVLFREDIK